MHQMTVLHNLWLVLISSGDMYIKRKPTEVLCNEGTKIP